ncbi:MAG: DUF4240 domain-containing protein [Phycisphaerales bacterium]
MTHQAMDETRFWQVIEPVSRIAGEDIDEQEVEMERQLCKLNDDDLVSFEMRYNRVHAAAYRWGLWEVAYFTSGGCSDDGFTYFRNWLIGRGRIAFDAVLINPDNLADYPMGKDPALSAQCVEWDMLPGQIWESREESRDDDQWFELVPFERLQPSDPIGEPFDEADVEGFKSRYPRLSTMYTSMLG